MDCALDLTFSPSYPIPAPYPFDHPQADLILRSSDSPPVDFRVFKLLLSLSSPFFSTLLTLPQPPPQLPISPLLSPRTIDGAFSDNELPSIVQMSEDQTTLRVLLGFCYPISTHEMPHFASLTELQSVIEAARKFEMDGILNHVRQNELVSPRFLEAQPVRVFAIGFMHHWVDEAKLAARYTLRHPIPGPYAEELERIPAGAYHRLQEYHQTCGIVASSRAEIAAASESDDRWVWLECRECPSSSRENDQPWFAFRLGSSQRGGPRQWWANWLKGVARLLQTRPRGETLRDYDLMRRALAEAGDCWFCLQRARDDLESFIQILGAQIEKDISQVELNVDFPS
ncbi:hypothetical protein FA13DRAFT_1757405 [Coprinellus micaceus]|uniref:BTB domain-containing protein n=1 Tax=Coprinellus micaceus TaxID=71717 RepID=A0A4Y7SJG3_COPMI|nr:hypothetical protein FA13DRAFT_1757405 [Coprinellus micaceus]